MIRKLLCFAAAVSLFAACSKKNNQHVISNGEPQYDVAAGAATNFPEGFEAGSKASYAAGTVTFTSGVWNLDNALVGTTASDHKTGAKSVRITQTGTLQMNFNVPNGASIVLVNHAVYGTDGASTWKLEASTDGGSTWSQVGGIVTTSSTSLSQALFAANLYGNVRVRIVKLSGGANRINIDDVQINDNSSADTQDDNLALGNPSGATNSTSDSLNYLMTKSQYTHSYNKSRGTPNWVSWHLSNAWKGSATRSTTFTTDATLPAGWYRVATGDYTNSGFDRGHMCPSEDRDLSTTDNQATFKMTNIVPQAPVCNQQTWKYLEEYSRTLINSGKELYIYSGIMGTGGTGSNGSANMIASGKVTVPAYVWKVIVVLPTGSDDISRVDSSANTRVIAVKVPNNQTVNAQTWGYYRVSVDDLESQLGYNFLSGVPSNIQNKLESAVDNGPTQ
jgi:endonuclease G